VNIFRLLKCNLQKVLTSIGFYICVLMTVILCFSAELYYNYNQNEGCSVIQAMINLSHKDMLKSTDFCSYNVLIKCTDGWLPMFIPIIAAFPFIPLLCNEYDSRSIRTIIFRTNKLSYNTGNFLSAMISGGLAITIGVVVFFTIIFFNFPDINEYEQSTRDSYEWWFNNVYPFFKIAGYPYLIILRFIEVFLFGAFSAIPSFVTTCFIRNKYLSISIPFFIKYAIIQTYSRLYIKVYNDILHPLKKLEAFLDTTDLNAVNHIFSIGKNMWKNCIFYLLLLMLSYFFYIFITNRRLDYGE